MMRTMMTGSMLSLVAMAVPGCAVQAAGDGEKIGVAVEQALTDNGESSLSKPIGYCGGQFAICGGWLGFWDGEVTLHAASSPTKMQVKIWDGASAWNGSPMWQTDDLYACQSSAGCQLHAEYKPGHAYTVVVQGCTQNWDNSYDCGVGSSTGWSQATIQAPNFKWGLSYDMAGNYMDPTDPQITQGGWDLDGTHLAVCMASGHPGKARYFGSTLYCDIGFGGQEIPVSQQATDAYSPNWNFKVLFTNPNAPGFWSGAPYVDWSQALTAGKDINGADLYVCRVWRPDGSLQPGKVINGPRGSCNYGFGGHEQVQAYPNYDVYTGPGLPTE